MSVREKLNLRALRVSKTRKQNKIYEKAQRIMQEALREEYLSLEEKEVVAAKYPQLRCKVNIGGDIFVTSKIGEWIIHEEEKFYSLYHKGMMMEKGRIKEAYHIQDVFYDLDFIFASIISHDDYLMGIAKRRMSDVEEIVRQHSE